MHICFGLALEMFIEYLVSCPTRVSSLHIFGLRRMLPLGWDGQASSNAADPWCFHPFLDTSVLPPAGIPPSHPSWIIDMHPAKVWPFTTCRPRTPSLNAARAGHLKALGWGGDEAHAEWLQFLLWPWPFLQPPPPTPPGHTFCAQLPVFPNVCHGLLCFEFGRSFYSSYDLIKEWPMQNKHPYPNASVIAQMCLTLEIGFLVS